MKQENFKMPDANIILIGIDTLRHGHLGFAGYNKNTSPNIDKLANESLVFKNCFSQAPTTGPSFASIFTSRYPTFHGVIGVLLENKGFRLAQNIPTFAEILKTSGYKTAAFTEGATLSAYVGLNKGFDVYETEPSSLVNCEAHPAVHWLEKNKKNKFFMFFHTFAAHAPYFSPEPYNHLHDPDYRGEFPSSAAEFVKLADKNNSWKNTFWNIVKLSERNPRDLEHVIALYDGCISYMDNFIGQFIKKLKQLDLYENTIIVFTSDHGEEFMEHGGVSHRNVYNEILHVPLIMKLPKINEHQEILQTVRSIDIMPTILECLGVAQDIIFQGISLLPAVQKTEMDLVAVSEFPTTFALNTEHYKYIYRAVGKTHNRIAEIYNLKFDPEEKNDLSGLTPTLIEKLHSEAQRELTKHGLARPPHELFMIDKNNDNCVMEEKIIIGRRNVY